METVHCIIARLYCQRAQTPLLFLSQRAQSITPCASVAPHPIEQTIQPDIARGTRRLHFPLAHAPFPQQRNHNDFLKARVLGSHRPDLPAARSTRVMVAWKLCTPFVAVSPTSRVQPPGSHCEIS